MTLAEPNRRDRAPAKASSTAPQPAADLGEAVVFDGRVGWLHWPARRRTSDVATTPGVVLCSAVGREEGCSHLTIRLLAEALANIGFAVLRYDHLGAGDSLDLAEEADQLPAWRDGVALAIDLLKARTGVRKIVLCGFRSGASLALLAAERADALVLLAPVLNGRSWIRELRLRAAFGAAAIADEGVALESDGLRLSAATLESLGRLDLTAPQPAPANVLGFCQNPAGAAQLAAAVAGASNLSIRDFDGYAAFLQDPDANQVPQEVIEATVAWLDRTYPCDAAVAAPAAPAPPLTAIRLQARGCSEVQVSFGEGLRGVLCTPDAPGRRAVLICNTGAEPRRGIGRFAVKAARALAAEGVASLRFDFAGIGESRSADGRTHSDVFETPRGADIKAAVGLLRQQGFDDVTLVGVCSGAYHAFRAVLELDDIRAAFVVSPARFALGGAAALAPNGDLGRSTAAYVDQALSPASWRRLISGKIDVAAVIRTLATRLRYRLGAGADRARTSALQRDVEALSRRGGRLRLLMGTDDLSLDETEVCFGPRGERLARLPGMSVRIDARIDHGVAYAASQALVLEDLLRFMTSAR